MAVHDNFSGPAPRTSLLNDPVFRGVIYQLLVVVLVVGFLGWIVLNTAQNLAIQNKTTGFDFLFRTAGFDIGFSLIPWSRASLYWEAFLAGLLNTLLAAVIGIFFATIIGFSLGIARLSSNWLIARVATVYIETIRNIPLLLQLFFWYFAVLKAMPAVRDSFLLPLGVYVNLRGIMVPKPLPDHEFTWVAVAFVVCLLAAIAIGVWATRQRTRTGRYPASIVASARIANAVVTFALGFIAFIALGQVIPTLATPMVAAAGALVLVGISFTPYRPFVGAFIAAVLAFTVTGFLLPGMFSYVPPAILLLVAAAIGLTVGWIMLERIGRTPVDASKFPVALPILVVVGIPLTLYYLIGAELAFEVPVLQRFNFQGGLQLPPEFVALVFGLSIYTAAFIAENVRGGIRAVSHGQTEAAQSLGLKDGDRLRLVIIPQAMRVIVPPLTSQYLNLTKNSSLGAAIGYAELVNVFMGTTLNQTGKAIEVVALTMAVYLTISLLTSAFMNWYNGRVALVER